jgi:hypothetical protein
VPLGHAIAELEKANTAVSIKRAAIFFINLRHPECEVGVATVTTIYQNIPIN